MNNRAQQQGFGNRKKMMKASHTLFTITKNAVVNHGSELKINDTWNNVLFETKVL